MAVLAEIAGEDVLGVLACGCGAVVTSKATAQHLRVIHFGCWFPLQRAVTVFAQIAAGNMRAVLAGCLCAVVTI